MLKNYQSLFHSNVTSNFSIIYSVILQIYGILHYWLTSERFDELTYLELEWSLPCPITGISFFICIHPHIIGLLAFWKLTGGHFDKSLDYKLKWFIPQPIIGISFLFRFCLCVMGLLALWWLAGWHFNVSTVLFTWHYDDIMNQWLPSFYWHVPSIPSILINWWTPIRFNLMIHIISFSLAHFGLNLLFYIFWPLWMKCRKLCQQTAFC